MVSILKIPIYLACRLYNNLNKYFQFLAKFGTCYVLYKVVMQIRSIRKKYIRKNYIFLRVIEY